MSDICPDGGEGAGDSCVNFDTDSGEKVWESCGVKWASPGQ